MGITLAFSFLGFLVQTFYEDQLKDPKVGLVGVILRTVFFVCIWGFNLVFACIAAGFSIVQVLRPFFEDLDDFSRENLMLEF